MLCAYHSNQKYYINKPGHSIRYDFINNLNIKSTYTLRLASRLNLECLRHVDGDQEYGTFTRRYTLFDDNLLSCIPFHSTLYLFGWLHT